MNYKTGEEFLNEIYKNMHLEDAVMHTANPSDKPTEKIGKYLYRLERVHSKAKEHGKMDMLMKYYYDKYVIDHLPESYISLQKKIAKERGYGNIEYSYIEKQEMLRQIQEEQKRSLKMWIDYFVSDDAMYPMWFKNYAFQGMLGLSKYDKEKHQFGKRTKDTVSPFVDLNRESLAQVYNILSSKIGEDNLTEEQLQALNNGESFKKIYAYFMHQTLEKNKSKEIDGIWIKYEQGDNYKPLWQSLQGKNTGWCTAGEETCKWQIEDGDFYVYYTKDKDGKYTDPRIAIRMKEQDEIAEIRGIEQDQNLEGEMTPILDEKLKEFGNEAIRYRKKVNDMEMLTYIYTKWQNNLNCELSIDELKFLYEIDDKIEGFGWQRDTRIDEVLSKRELKRDLTLVFDCNEDEIGFVKEDLFKPLKVYYGDLFFPDSIMGENITFPKRIHGNLDLGDLTSAEGLKLPEEIDGSLDLFSLTSAKGLQLPKTIGVGLLLSNLTSAKGLQLPEIIDGNLDLESLTSAEGLKLPEIIGGLNLGSLTSAEGLKLPKEIDVSLDLFSLTSAKGLQLPKEIGGSLNLDSLTSVEGLKLPYNFNLNHLSLCSYTANLERKQLAQSMLEEIKSHPEKYFRTEEEEKELFDNDEKTDIVEEINEFIEQVPYENILIETKEEMPTSKYRYH